VGWSPLDPEPRESFGCRRSDLACEQGSEDHRDVPVILDNILISGGLKWAKFWFSTPPMNP
jgi:hypothetical protein